MTGDSSEPSGLAAVSTPALLLDETATLANITRVNDRASTRGRALWPHAKTHKSVRLAKAQLNAGAAGITVATIDEATVFAHHGITDLFIAYPLYVSAAKERAFADLVASSTVRVGVAHHAGARTLAPFAHQLAGVLLEINSGQNRSGVLPQDAPALATACTDMGLNVLGVFTHAGHSYAQLDAPEPVAHQEHSSVLDAAAALRAAHFDVPVISIGANPTARFALHHDITEERPGVYIFGDMQQVMLQANTIDQVALSVLATVVDVHPDRFVVDAGSKALSTDRPSWAPAHGLIMGYPNAVLTRLSEHHGVAETTGPQPAVGDLVQIIPNHACTVVNLFDHYTVLTTDGSIQQWPIDARGCLT